jgi:hypothetical protein
MPDTNRAPVVSMVLKQNSGANQSAPSANRTAMGLANLQIRNRAKNKAK